MNNKFFTSLILVTIISGQPPSTINASIKTAKMLERTGNISGAIAIYEAMLLKNPNHPQSVQNLKSLYKNNSQYVKGIQFLRKQLSRFPNNLKTYAELGEFHFLNDQKAEAKSVWSAGLEKFKVNRSYYRIMLSMYGKHSLDEEIFKLLKFGRNTFGEQFLAYETGIYFQNRRVYDRAMEQFILSLYHEPKQGRIIERRILLMSDEDEAVPIIEQVLKTESLKNQIIIYDVLSSFYFKQQRYEKSFKIKKKGQEFGEIDYNKWLKFANDLRKERQYQHSIDAYNYILSQNLHSNLTGKALLGLAQSFEDQIIPSNETYLIPYFFDNNIFFEDPFQVYSTISPEHLKSSISLYDSLLITLVKSPLLADAYYRLGEIQYRILQDFDQAELLFHKALKSNPNTNLRLKIILRTSDVLLAKGQHKEALAHLEREIKKTSIPSIKQKKILVHFLTDHPDSTLKFVESSFYSMSPIDPSFNDLMELKNILTEYYQGDQKGKKAFKHFLKSELYLRQKKIGDSIKELMYINQEMPSAKIVPLANLRLSLLHYRLKEYEISLKYALSLSETFLADKGIILAGQIYESKLLEPDKALEQYMRIIDEFPLSIFSEPIRFHIRQIQELES